MKHRMITVVLLATVLVLLLAVPAAADNGKVPFDFQWQNVGFGCEYAYPTADTWHWLCTFTADIVSTNPMLDGEHMVLEMKGASVLANPHPIYIGDAWGPLSAKWSILMDDKTGWEGTSHCGPWGDAEQYPKSLVQYFNGKGYGAYAGQHIWYEVFGPPQIPAVEYVFHGVMQQ